MRLKRSAAISSRLSSSQSISAGLQKKWERRKYAASTLTCSKEKKLAPGTVETRISALRFLYKKTLKWRDLSYDDLIFPKTPQKLPVVLSQEEVRRLIEAAPNLMYRTMLMVLYSTGIRRTEASVAEGKRHRWRTPGASHPSRRARVTAIPIDPGTHKHFSYRHKSTATGFPGPDG